jgi:hypothetical protein
MTYIDYDKLEAIDIEAYRNTKPYPYLNPAGLLTDQAFETLRTNLPPMEAMQPFFGVQRSHGQQAHDRYVLEFEDHLEIPAPWREFITELRGSRYKSFLYEAFDTRFLQLNFHWHYTPNGCSVSPHCDAKHKLGSHIFYFNTADDWDARWGGETVVLDDGGRFPRDSAPKFEEFDRIIHADAMGNRSFLFTRRGNSWHGVQEIKCPEGKYRKVFIVVINDWKRFLKRTLRARIKGQKASSY